MTIYRKPTHTDRLLDQSSYNPTSHKATTIRTLTRRVQLVCDSPDSLTDENKYLDNVFNKNNNIAIGTLLDTTLTETPNQTLRTLTRHLSLLQPYLTSKGLLKLSHESYNPTTSALLTNLSLLYEKLLTNVKDKGEPSDRRGAVYKIKCCDCQATYVGETGGNLNVRLTEHKRATRNFDINNHIAERHLKTNHRIDWDSAECATCTHSTDYYQLRTNTTEPLPTAACTLQTTDCRQ